MQEAGDYRRLDRFDAVEATGEAELFQTFLEQVDRIADVSARRRRSFALVGARPGSHLADVGCGLGTAAREMAALVAPGGSVIGVDVSDSMVSAAEERTPLGTAEVTFRVGDATSLPIEDGELTGYRAERLYQHLSRPDLALAEASRVLATGGRLVLVDQDWDCLAFDSDDRTTTRAVIRAFADSLVDGWIGRRYHALLVDAGFVDIDVIAETSGLGRLRHVRLRHDSRRPISRRPGERQLRRSATVAQRAATARRSRQVVHGDDALPGRGNSFVSPPGWPRRERDRTGDAQFGGRTQFRPSGAGFGAGEPREDAHRVPWLDRPRHPHYETLVRHGCETPRNRLGSDRMIWRDAY